MRKFFIISLLALLVFIFFLFRSSISAVTTPPLEETPPEEEECIPGPEACGSSAPYRCNDFAVYKCANNFCGKNGGSMEQGVKWYECVDVSCSDGCSSWGWTEVAGGPYGPDQIKPYGQVPAYQICPASHNDWNASPLTPECSGFCYPAPNLKSLSDPDLLPKNVSQGSQYKLPINFGWEDNVKKEVAKAPSLCTVGSYEFNIVDPPRSQIVADTQLQKLEDPAYKLECQLKSNANYQWRVRACLDSGGTDCGEWPKNQNFKTSLTPELITPYDPDWVDSKGAENVSIPTKFEWCNTAPYTNTKTYYVRLYKNGKIYYPFPVEKQNGVLNSETVFDIDVLTKYTNYQWEIANCATEDNTKCGINCTEKQEGSDCGDYGQKWAFTTGEITLPAPKIISPDTKNGIPVINRSDNLSWEPIGLYGVEAYYYEIKKNQDIIATSSVLIEITSVSFADFWQKLHYDETYTAEVKSCWNEAGTKCDPGTKITFKTTGAAPNLIFPDQNAQNVVIPTNLNWDDVPGALLYKYQIVSDPAFANILKTGTTTKSEGLVDYPTLKQNIKYYWRVSSCADKNGYFCADLENIWSEVRNFTTFTLAAPSNPVPANGNELSTSERYLKWDKVLGAKFYQYQITPGIDGITPINSAFFKTGELSLGTHNWQVRACLDEDCQEAGEWSNFSFNLVQPEGCEKEKALVPCGRNCNSDATPWDDRKPCQFQHIFLVFKNILDFVLWTLVPLILVLLAILSGVIYYTSLGDAATMAKVKSIWRSVGIGCLIIFSAWSIVDWILLILGFQVQIFGKWWQSPF